MVWRYYQSHLMVIFSTVRISPCICMLKKLCFSIYCLCVRERPSCASIPKRTEVFFQFRLSISLGYPTSITLNISAFIHPWKLWCMTFGRGMCSFSLISHFIQQWSKNPSSDMICRIQYVLPSGLWCSLHYTTAARLTKQDVFHIFKSSVYPGLLVTQRQKKTKLTQTKPISWTILLLTSLL